MANVKMLDKPEGKTRENCHLRGGWNYCVVCEGRIHLQNCTSRRNPEKDCCLARHKMLHEQGQTKGLIDSSLTMYDPNNPTY
jgi:hypothetical protein